MTVTVYQIEISNADADAYNAGEKVAKVEAWSIMMLGAKKWKDEFADMYTAVYEVATDDLETAFEQTNFNGPLVTNLVPQARSSSVGDLFVLNGVAYVVDSFGFQEIGSAELLG